MSGTGIAGGGTGETRVEVPLSDTSRLLKLGGGILGILAGVGLVVCSVFFFFAFFVCRGAGGSAPVSPWQFPGAVALLVGMFLVGLVLAAAAAAFFRMKVWVTDAGFESTYMWGLRTRKPWESVSSLRIGTEITFLFRGRERTIDPNPKFGAAWRGSILRMWRSRLTGRGFRSIYLGTWPLARPAGVPFVLCGFLVFAAISMDAALAVPAPILHPIQIGLLLLGLLSLVWSFLTVVCPTRATLRSDSLEFSHLARRRRIPLDEAHVVLLRRLADARQPMLLQPVGGGRRSFVSVDPGSRRLVLRLLRRRSRGSLLIDEAKLGSLKPTPLMLPDTRAALESVLSWVRVRGSVVGTACIILGMAILACAVPSAILHWEPPVQEMTQSRPSQDLHSFRIVTLFLFAALPLPLAIRNLLLSRTARGAIERFRSEAPPAPPAPSAPPSLPAATPP